MAEQKRSHIDLLELRDRLTSQLSESPYSYFIYLKRAQCYGDLGYPDLGAGDAYRALLLIDEISDDSGEYHEQAVETLQNHLARGSSIEGNTERKCEGKNDLCKQANNAGQEDSSFFLSPESLTVNDDRLFCFALLSHFLTQCGCLRSAYDFAERGLGYSPSDSRFLSLRSQIVETYNTTLLVKDRHCDDCNFSAKGELPEQGYSRRELYPWNHHEPDRFSDESLRSLDGQIKKLAPKCEIRSVELPVLEAETSNTSFKPSTTTKQLGIFATEDIAPHETVLRETSILTANNRLHDPLCDACSGPLPSISSSLHTPLPTCPECDDIIFCSPACHSAATSLYHPAVCGKPDLEAVAKDPSPVAATNALYLLLLGRAFALSETQSIHPLDLPEIKYLWGDFMALPPPPPPSSSSPSEPDDHLPSSSTVRTSLPFTFHDNILAPLHLFEKMDLDPFTALARTDTWVTQTLLAKFRAVASARMNPRTGVPEVCAVHPMWCLANHSCAPNVRWEWVGDMEFVARGEEEVVRWGDDGERKGGIRKAEEVLSHYCDVDLGVQERRAWAVGPLGGTCICERCVWEERREKEKEKKEEVYRSVKESATSNVDSAKGAR
ncbi:MAG: hypothetical protein LQ341_004088 [Variospora aurantia]|nr:MAG: hypothetical protein LQ341_004088 [Variospora aurantia]